MKTNLKTLKYVKAHFDMQSDHSTKTHGYRILCEMIETVENSGIEQSPRPDKTEIYKITNGLRNQVITNEEAEKLLFDLFGVNPLEIESPRPVEDGNDCECVNSELLVEYSGGYCRCKWCGKKMTHMDVSEGNPSSSRPQENDKSDMDIVAKFPEQKTIKAKLVYEQPEHDVSEDDLRTAIENALYATHRFLTTDCSDLADGILLYMKDAGYFASLREVKMPDRDDYIRYVSKNYEGVHVYYMIIAFDYVISELKRINNLK